MTNGAADRPGAGERENEMKANDKTHWTVIGTLGGNIVRAVELAEPEELERGEYRHPYEDGDAWLPVYATQAEALEAATRHGHHVVVEE